jgi:hypothetical protein
MLYTLTISYGVVGFTNQNFLLLQSNIYRKNGNDNFKKKKKRNYPPVRKRGLEGNCRLNYCKIRGYGGRQIKLDENHFFYEALLLGTCNR